MKADHAKREKTTQPQFFWANQLPELAMRRFCIQTVLWRETLSAMAGVAGLQAECLRKLACVNTPLDALAIQKHYLQQLVEIAEEEGNRLAMALTRATLAQPEAA